MGTIRDAINEEKEGGGFFCLIYILRCVVDTCIPSEEDRLSQKKEGPSRRWLRRKRLGASPAGERSD